MPTSSGDVQVRAVGDNSEACENNQSGGTFIALGGLGRRGMGPGGGVGRRGPPRPTPGAPTTFAPPLTAHLPPPTHADWLRAGIPQLLAESGTRRVLLPDPYSCDKTRPSLGEFAVVLSVATLGGLWRGTCKEKWLLDLPPPPLELGGGRSSNPGPVILAGHSYGGGAAARAAADNPDAVSRLVLVSPDVEWSVARRCWSIPTLLIWARDDYVNPYLWTSRWSGHPNLTIHTEATGGHMLLEKHGAQSQPPTPPPHSLAVATLARLPSPIAHRPIAMRRPHYPPLPSTSLYYHPSPPPALSRNRPGHCQVARGAGRRRCGGSGGGGGGGGDLALVFLFPLFGRAGRSASL